MVIFNLATYTIKAVKQSMQKGIRVLKVIQKFLLVWEQSQAKL